MIAHNVATKYATLQTLEIQLRLKLRERTLKFLKGTFQDESENDDIVNCM